MRPLGMWRSFHMCRGLLGPAVAVEKSTLAKLRKATGYSFVKCKEALEKHDNDVKQAESWLREQAQAHGWEKATKLQGRATGQGLVAILASQHNAVMAEINCETDFVARNKKFQSLVNRVTQACYNYSDAQKPNSVEGGVVTNGLNQSDLGAVRLNESRSLQDEIAVSIGEIGENIQARRAVLVQSSGPVLLAGYTHPAAVEAEKEVVQFGRFGAVIAYKFKDSKRAEKVAAEVGRQLCQHIVGMNPSEIGKMSEVSKKKAPVQAKEVPKEGESSEDQDSVNVELVDDTENVLLNQEFLLDPDLTVRDFLLQHGAEVVDFVRFECGENIQSGSA